MEHISVKLPWPNWEIVKVLGKGSFGIVYEIQRTQFGLVEKSALKLMTIPKEKEEVDDLYTEGYDQASIQGLYQDYLEKIEKEYYLLRKMNGHPNIVSIEDYFEMEHKDEIGWDVFIRMELLNPLQNYLRDHEMSEDEIIKLGKDICQALIACENENIIHRDIKPHNILVSHFGNFKLADFGVAKTMDHTTYATRIGTESYMAPEVEQGMYGKEVDIYSLGLVLYWLLNRRRLPFLPIDRPPTAKEKSEALYKRLRGDQIPKPVDGSEELKEVILKACAYNIEDRYSSAGEMLKELEKISFEIKVKEDEITENSKQSSHIHESVETSKTETDNHNSNMKNNEDITEAGNLSEDSGEDHTISLFSQNPAPPEKVISPKSGKTKAKDSRKKPKILGGILLAIALILVVIIIVIRSPKSYVKINGKKYNKWLCKELDLTDRGITSIKGIEKLRNLEKLNLQDNTITDISSLGKLKKLKILNLRNNQISDISTLTKLKNLKVLDISDNPIEDYSPLRDSENSRNFEEFYLENNQIHGISGISKLTNLKTLSLKDNLIDDISGLEELKNLETLDLCNNRIRDISTLTKLKNLKELYIRNNPIENYSPLNDMDVTVDVLELDLDL